MALALSIPAHEHEGDAPVPERDVLAALTYVVVVVFSILVQGMTVGPLNRRWLTARPEQPTGQAVSE